MKSFTTKILIFFIFSAGFLSCAQNAKTKENTKQNEKIITLISPKELHDSNNNIQLIDVRTPEEFSEGHIKSAVNINFYDDTFIKDMSSKLDKSKPIYIYCRSGGRSGKAAKKLEAEGFTKVYDLKGGFINWKDNKMDIAK